MFFFLKKRGASYEKGSPEAVQKKHFPSASPSIFRPGVITVEEMKIKFKKIMRYFNHFNYR